MAEQPSKEGSLRSLEAVDRHHSARQLVAEALLGLEPQLQAYSRTTFLRLAPCRAVARVAIGAVVTFMMTTTLDNHSIVVRSKWGVLPSLQR